MLQCDQRFSKDDPDSAQIFKGFFTVENEKGLHTRPSMELVRCSSKFKSQINLILENMVVNGKSILGILMLAACEGTKIEIEAKGPDAKEAIEAVLHLSKKNFNINY